MTPLPETIEVAAPSERAAEIAAGEPQGGNRCAAPASLGDNLPGLGVACHDDTPVGQVPRDSPVPAATDAQSPCLGVPAGPAASSARQVEGRGGHDAAEHS